MDPTEPTLQQLLAVFGQQCDGAVMAFHLASSNDRRVAALEKILDFAYDDLVNDRHLNQKHGEDALSVQIIKQLKFVAIDANHDIQVGGHCDILVRARDRFLWIAEAKIHKSFGWLHKGFLQLSTRFGSAAEGRDHGEIIIYCRMAKAGDVLSRWKDYLLLREPVEICEDRIDNQLWFRTRHTCPSSALYFYTRHRIIPLFWSPQDR
ncbi:hypothetical protein [Sinorhizobium prairiense]|uniref:hypothetical protein n=1 Tax=unclassified Sinorhizobium TaxID=2613772 RepID=UPI0023D8B9B7|nr:MULTISPECIES: hypothetical protein [unclassified Sinorhizobium]WEJ08437.1 hypothetical protein N0Q90_01725 [Sinorhizobium sp. M103]WEJ14057.1 hypothetical protein N0Q91_00980 [Sinorhizobium sp. K101]WEJ35658.1 hypothetical protein N0R80_00980 [Sinorhizobium sp. C101]